VVLTLAAAPLFGGPPAASTPGAQPARVRLVQIAQLDQPLALAVRPGDDSFYVAERTGRVRRVSREGDVAPEPVLDLSAEVSQGVEQGLVGLAFDPRGDRLYVGFTDLTGDSRILEYAFDGRRAVASTRRQLLFVDQPQEWHNNGQVIFGPDGLLYLGFGDGGPVRESEHRSQDLGTLFSKVLRIDPRPTADAAYRVPDDNPFVGREGARPEVWMYGLRNPWRFTFDRATGDFWVGDVGDLRWEEVDVLAAGKAGANFGWDAMEGRHPRPTPPDPTPPPPDHVLPVFEYEHVSGRCAVIGGYVYRGRLAPELQGAYLFGDLCDGTIMALRRVNGEAEAQDLGIIAERLTSFGEDADGEVYVMSQEGGLYRLESLPV
jgi:glucose/arabinose dehydrogenase